MTISLEQLSAQMRRGEQVPLRHTMQVVLTLSIPSILSRGPCPWKVHRSPQIRGHGRAEVYREKQNPSGP